jgi:AraC-like DNA-binding protein
MFEKQKCHNYRTDPFTNIAHKLGFSSSQYFATVFRRETGMTPGEYRQSHLKG